MLDGSDPASTQMSRTVYGARVRTEAVPSLVIYINGVMTINGRGCSTGDI